MKSKAVQSLSSELQDIVARVGRNIRTARKRRRMTQAELAVRANTTPPTIRTIEEGSPAVSVGVLLKVLSILGLEDAFAELAAPESDQVGISEEERRLPKRVVPIRDLEREFMKR